MAPIKRLFKDIDGFIKPPPPPPKRTVEDKVIEVEKAKPTKKKANAHHNVKLADSEDLFKDLEQDTTIIPESDSEWEEGTQLLLLFYYH